MWEKEGKQTKYSIMISKRYMARTFFQFAPNSNKLTVEMERSMRGKSVTV